MGLKNKIIEIAIACIPAFIKRRIINGTSKDYSVIYSQEGEDKLLERFIGRKNFGTFIDVGAHHPTLINNTYYFYKKGWRGLNIDAIPSAMDLFNKLRPEDTNIEQAVSDEEEVLTFHMFNTPELNTFDRLKIDEFLKFPGVQLQKKIELKTQRLETILDKYIPTLKIAEIDFMTVDVEGFDLRVLKSNNWDKYRPNFILAEDLFSTIIESYNGELNAFMRTIGYTMKAKTFNTVLFQKDY